MCGIVGFAGGGNATSFLLEGLEKLEYRGYDSAGVAVNTVGNIEVVKAKGRLSNLCEVLKKRDDVNGAIGIGHTRWATHGEPSDINSHPHSSLSGTFAVVHNGIIDNYLELKDYLTKKGHVFQSDTDTEVISHLLEYYYGGDLLETVFKVLGRLQGSYALGILCKDNPDQLIAVKKDSPLIIGYGEGEKYIASDIPAIFSRTREIYRLEENEVAVLTRDSVTIYNSDKEQVQRDTFIVNWDISSAEKGGYPHFMLKEIMEQPEALRNTINPRIKDGKVVLDELKYTKEYLSGLQKICVVACGSAYHAGVVGKYVLEQMTRKPVETALASEFRYCFPIIDEKTLVIIVSQSGETADTLAAMREAKRLGARTLSIVNVVGSSIASESDDVLYTWAGPEIAVATTKAYSAQLAVFYLLSLYIADTLGSYPKEELNAIMDGLTKLPQKVEEVLKQKEAIQYFASSHFNSKDIFFIGRNLDYAMSLEGSLKLKEISYIHSEAYAAGELKHGTLSLIEKGTLVVALATQDRLFDKMVSNIKEVKARGGVVLGLAKEGNNTLESVTDGCLYIPVAHDLLLPSLAVVPLQFFSYYVASMKGCDIDKPRNLAKSVTVE